jgi:hypothetical protein
MSEIEPTGKVAQTAAQVAAPASPAAYWAFAPVQFIWISLQYVVQLSVPASPLLLLLPLLLPLLELPPPVPELLLVVPVLVVLLELLVLVVPVLVVLLLLLLELVPPEPLLPPPQLVTALSSAPAGRIMAATKKRLLAIMNPSMGASGVSCERGRPQDVIAIHGSDLVSNTSQGRPDPETFALRPPHSEPKARSFRQRAEGPEARPEEGPCNRVRGIGAKRGLGLSSMT